MAADRSGCPANPTHNGDARPSHLFFLAQLLNQAQLPELGASNAQKPTGKSKLIWVEHEEEEERENVLGAETPRRKEKMLEGDLPEPQNSYYKPGPMGSPSGPSAPEALGGRMSQADKEPVVWRVSSGQLGMALSNDGLTDSSVCAIMLKEMFLCTHQENESITTEATNSAVSLQLHFPMCGTKTSESSVC
ncbi:hypothetical protein P7K49_028393 [Saguinus oedipus]|uniref:Uncharacterized protein n=1 Tax=Saguinus oedipus TaxID=9490 RepID=A0ABQ9UC97_SAGOE|nr:hypothetical protein P7K49_028393 [Saguinus oedipus]